MPWITVLIYAPSFVAVTASMRPRRNAVDHLLCSVGLRWPAVGFNEATA